jgi:peptidoglycan/xylan/chitin deacetylase (PgdA/CDA1 family)
MIVLNYHRLCAEEPADLWTLSHTQLESHAEAFGPTLVSPDAFLERCRVAALASTGDVLLTFDDGCESDYTVAFPRFAGENGPGFMSFVITDIVGRSGHLDWTMIEEMDRHGVAFGSHSASHADLTRLSPGPLREELGRSKEALEDRLGHPVSLLAFPYGAFNRHVWSAALEAGYTHLFTTQLGYHNGFESFLFSRLCVTNAMDASYLREHLEDPSRNRGLGWRISSSLGLYRPMMRLRYR